MGVAAATKGILLENDVAGDVAEESLAQYVRQAWHVIEPQTAYLHNWHIDAIAEHREAVTFGELRRLIINIPPRYGKLAADSTPVLTANRGWTTHGELIMGDQVFSPDGAPTRVVSISQPDAATMEVETVEGAIIKVHPGHEWTVYDRLLKRWRTMETREFVAKGVTRNSQIKLIHGAPGKRGAHCRFHLPDRQALQYPEAELPIPPYALGAWLGDGTSQTGRVTYQERCRPMAVAVGQAFEPGGEQQHAGTGIFTRTFYGFGTALRALGLINNKHVPEMYLRSSVRQRLELLAGLIDTDGSVDKGRVFFVNSNPRVVSGVVELIRGLGWHAGVIWVDPPPPDPARKIQQRVPCCYLSFTPDRAIPTVLKWKQPRGTRVPRRIGIRDVRMAASTEVGHCITVDSADGLYLIGRELVPTHNSNLVSVFWPTWEWGPRDMAYTRWLFGSYAANLSLKHSNDRRTIMRAVWYRERWGNRFKLYKDVESEYYNDKRGHVIATSVSGSATGKGGNRIVIDDFLDPLQAMSDLDRNKANQSFDSKFFNRQDDKKRDAVVIIMQRLHEDDLTGHVLEGAKAEAWTVLSIPGEAETKTTVIFPRSKTKVTREPRKATMIEFRTGKVISRDDNGLLWPEREGPEEIEEQKINMGSYVFAGQYQQHPAPLGGGLIKRKWFRFFRVLPKINRLILAADTAFTEKQTADYSVIQVWGQADAGFFLIDQWRMQVEFPELKRISIWYNALWSPAAFLIEDAASGQSLIQELRRPPVEGSEESRMTGVSSIPVVPVAADRDKMSRASAVTPMIEAQLVWLPENAPWLEDFLKEATFFPNAKNDDQVDTMAHALKYLRGEGAIIEFYRRQLDAQQQVEEALKRGEEPPPAPKNRLVEIYEKSVKQAQAKLNQGGSKASAAPVTDLQRVAAALFGSRG